MDRCEFEYGVEYEGTGRVASCPGHRVKCVEVASVWCVDIDDGGVLVCCPYDERDSAVLGFNESCAARGMAKIPKIETSKDVMADITPNAKSPPKFRVPGYEHPMHEAGDGSFVWYFARSDEIQEGSEPDNRETIVYECVCFSCGKELGDHTRLEQVKCGMLPDPYKAHGSISDAYGNRRFYYYEDPKMSSMLDVETPAKAVDSSADWDWVDIHAEDA